MIPWWGWVLCIGLGIATAPFWFAGLLKVAEWGQHLGYAREARIHNKKARLLRLERTEWNGFPLPTGEKGTLHITYDQMVKNPQRVSSSQLERTYVDRGLDLRVDLEVLRDPITRDYIVSWRHHKGRWPKERY